MHVERVPAWGAAAAALTIVVAALAALRVVWTITIIVPFVASTLARRLALTATDATVDDAGLWLGGKLAAARADVTDVWFDSEDHDFRVTVAARPDRMIVLHLANKDQARRFVAALTPPAHDHRVAGVRPGALDALVPLRLLAIVVAFVATSGSPVSALLLVFSALGAYGIVVGTQVDARADALELRTVRGVKRIAYDDVASIDVEEGAITRKDGQTVAIRAGVVRDALLASTGWTKRAHERVLAHAARRVRTDRTTPEDAREDKREEAR